MTGLACVIGKHSRCDGTSTYMAYRGSYRMNRCTCRKCNHPAVPCQVCRKVFKEYLFWQKKWRCRSCTRKVGGPRW